MVVNEFKDFLSLIQMVAVTFLIPSCLTLMNNEH
jgi:hypothetical protein